MDDGLIVKLKFLLPNLPRAEKVVAKYMLDNFDKVSDMTLTMLAEETGASEATVIRLCKDLGFSGYIKLRQAFASASFSEDSEKALSIGHAETIAEIYDKVCANITNSLTSTKVFINEGYDAALAALLKARAVFFFCTGDSGPVCEYAKIKFQRICIPAFFEEDVMQQYESAMRTTPDDVAIFVSNSGRSSNVVTAAKLAKQNGCTTISITQSARSPLGKYIDIPIYMSALDHTVGRDSITRRIVAMTVLETLYQAVVSHGSRNFPAMLEATMNSFEINSVLHK